MTPAQLALFEQNKGLAYAKAGKYARARPSLKYVYDDLRQEALFALAKAAKTFNPKGPYPFAPGYAGYKISNHLRQYIRDECGLGTVDGKYWEKNGFDYTSPGALPDGGAEALPAVRTVTPEVLASNNEVLRLYEQWRERDTVEYSKRNVAVFHEMLLSDRAESRGAALALRLGISRQRLHQLAAKVRPHFEAWAKRIRQEAA